MPLTTIAIIVNAIFLLLSFITAGVMLQTGSRYFFYYGIDEIQVPLKWRMLRLLVLLIAIGLIGALFNLLIVFI